MKRNVDQNKQLYGLWARLNITDPALRATLVLQFTNDRTSSSSDMLVDECQNLINTLRHKVNNPKQTPQKRQYNGIEQDARRKIFSLFYEVGFICNEDTPQRKVIIINAWVKDKLNLKKGFNDLTEEELQKMNNQLQAVKRNYKEAETKQAKLN